MGLKLLKFLKKIQVLSCGNAVRTQYQSCLAISDISRDFYYISVWHSI